jgi:regulation of enolase protein 1 (concanavalin A-like superfamily)
MEFKTSELTWIRPPKTFSISPEKITITTDPNTDLWQRTYYGFQNDNAPVLQMKTSEKYFSFITKTNFASKTRFDQSGVVMYLDSDNWFKASVEYENEKIQRLGSVVTQNGYSDWCSTDISAEIKSIWFRFSRRESDYYIEYSMDGKDWKQMRIFHMFKGNEEISFGIYACSPGKAASFDAEFTNMELTECKWEKEG